MHTKAASLVQRLDQSHSRGLGDGGRSSGEFGTPVFFLPACKLKVSMAYMRANLIAFVHYAIAVLPLMIYSWIDTPIEQSVPRYAVPATLIVFGVTTWAACRCAYSYGLRDSNAKTDASTEYGDQQEESQGA